MPLRRITFMQLVQDAALRRRASKPRLPRTKVRDGDAHDCLKQPAGGVQHAEEILPSPLTMPLTAKPLWQSSGRVDQKPEI